MIATDDERALAARAHVGDAVARAELVLAHRPLVCYLARRLRGSCLPYGDLVGEGLVELLRVVDRYDPGRGPRLAALAGPNVLGAMRNALRRERRARADRRAPEGKVISARAPGVWPRADGRWEAVLVVGRRPFLAALCPDRAAAAAAYDRATAALARGGAGA